MPNITDPYPWRSKSYQYSISLHKYNYAYESRVRYDYGKSIPLDRSYGYFGSSGEQVLWAAFRVRRECQLDFAVTALLPSITILSVPRRVLTPWQRCQRIKTSCSPVPPQRIAENAAGLRLRRGEYAVFCEENWDQISDRSLMIDLSRFVPGCEYNIYRKSLYSCGASRAYQWHYRYWWNLKALN